MSALQEFFFEVNLEPLFFHLLVMAGRRIFHKHVIFMSLFLSRINCIVPLLHSLTICHCALHMLRGIG